MLPCTKLCFSFSLVLRHVAQICQVQPGHRSMILSLRWLHGEHIAVWTFTIIMHDGSDVQQRNLPPGVRAGVRLRCFGLIANDGLASEGGVVRLRLPGVLETISESDLGLALALVFPTGVAGGGIGVSPDTGRVVNGEVALALDDIVELIDM
jgi:hypothetical protein